jgi:uncharacterized protein involved in exopolysaccharide biosynthesis
MGRAVMRRKREFLTVFVTVALTVLIASFLWPATYVARAAILIQKTRSAPGLDAAGEHAPTVVSAGISEQEVNSEIAVLTSREVLDKTLVETHLDTAPISIWRWLLFGPLWLYEDAYAWYHGVALPTRADRALRGLESSISVEPMKESNVLVVSYECGNPSFCAVVLKQLLDNYLVHHVEVHRRADVEAFFDGQANSLKTDLAAQEDKLQALKRSVGVADLASEREVQQKIVASLREEDEQLKRTMAELDERIAAYQKFLHGDGKQMQQTTVEGRNDFALQSLVQEKLRLDLERVRLLERYTPDSPLIAENQRKIDAASAAIENERSSVLQKQSALSPAAVSASQEMERTRAERAGDEERIAKLEEQITAANARLTDLDEKLLEAKRIERVIATTESQYLQYLRRGVEARIDAALDQGQFTNASVVQEPAAEPHPIRPKTWLSLILAVVGGVVAATGTVVGLELKDDGLESFLGSVAPPAAETR